MLSRPDDDLVRRDPDLPGIGTLLDGEAFTAVLRDAVPAFAGAAARPLYVRYKPGTRCLVAYAIDGSAAATHVHANAYSRARWRERAWSGQSRVDDLAIEISCFPHDAKLPVIRRLWDPLERRAIAAKLVPGHAALHAPDVETLAYKPGRRYVGLLSGVGARAAIKVYGEGVPESARAADRRLESSGPLEISRCIGRSRRHRALVFEWLAGERLSEALATHTFDPARLRNVGAALAELHRQLGRSLIGPVPQEARVLAAVARGVGVLCPSLADRARQMAGAAASAVSGAGSVRQPIHGDFYASQVLLGDDRVGILDLDRAAWGDRAFDLGTFVAHLEYAVIAGGLSAALRDAAAGELIGGYEHAADLRIADAVPVHAAAALLRLAPRPFRTRAAAWDERTSALLDRVDSLLVDGRVRRPARPADPDPAVPSGALDAATVERHLARLPRLYRLGADIRVRAIRIARHKAGRRTLIEYDLEARSHGALGHFTAIGKVRAKGADARTHSVIEALWNAGFGRDPADGILVPEPLGIAPELKLCLQRRVRGAPVSASLDTREGPKACSRAAEAVHKLHRAGVEPPRNHSAYDELAILEKRLILAAADRPSLRPRLETLLDACRTLVRALPPSILCAVHRDFHPDQLLLDGDRAWLLDLDLFATSDPALDAGNFLAHIAEYSLRRFGDPNRLAPCEQAFLGRFLELAPDVPRASIDAYRTLSLVRLVHISTLFPGRRPFTERLIEYCESRLRLAALG